ncbi:MAG: glycine--tRNA ligase subunit beta [Acidobacteria bacterium]|nr:MAG: glycine--tRNA ligase subunit beta [Acidobacteriota bacterium]
MAELLIEIGIEEVPARMLARAVRELADGIKKTLSQADIKFEDLQASGAPRQLLIYAADVQEKQQDREETVMGPPVRIAFDADGNPTRALQGFLKKNTALKQEDLKRVSQPKGEILAGTVFVKGKKTKDILAEAVPGLLARLSFPKKMKWGSGDAQFVRPVRNILALFGGKVIPFEFAGVQSGNVTFGHRFHGKARFEVDSIESYLKLKEENAVIVSSEQRVAMIKEQIDRHLKRVGGKLVEDPGLMRELPELVEVPYVVCGEFNPEFLEIPREILITSLREHQKSFCVEDESGQLMPYFLSVASTVQDDKGLIKKGNEWVLKARLWDAHFFWGSDRKKDFETMRAKLKNLVFQVKIGDYYQKTERIEKIASSVADHLGLQQDQKDIRYAARHCKTDLFSELVFEFPELQGVVGGLLLEEKGKSETIYKGVYEHYLPMSMEDDMPTETSSSIVSIADKMDTLVGCFAVGLKPTGTKDPYALRRAAQGVIRVLMERDLPLKLSDLLNCVLSAYEGTLAIPEETPQEIEDFMIDRMRYILKRKGYSYDLVEAVLAADSERIDLLIPRADAVKTQVDRGNFISLFRNLKRMKNVIQDEEDRLVELDESLFEDPIEKELWSLFTELQTTITDAIDHCAYNDAMDAMAGLVDPVEAYFSPDGVFVNAEDEKVRLNRKAMLKIMRDTLGLVADLTCLEVK